MARSERLARLAAVALIALTAAAQAQDPQPDKLVPLTAGMPDDVAAFIPRLAGCLRWGGHYSEDPARAERIADGMAKYGCATLDIDQEALLARYKENPAVLDRLARVRAAYGEGD
jgi:hypothetical protein